MEDHHACADFVHDGCDFNLVHSCASPAADGTAIRAVQLFSKDSSAPFLCLRCGDGWGIDCPPPAANIRGPLLRCNATRAGRDEGTYRRCMARRQSGGSGSGSGEHQSERQPTDHMRR